MFFNAEDDEGDFMSPSSGSKLGALFGIDQASNQGGNSSLKYSAPKQPKGKAETNSNSGGTTAAPAVLNAVAVHAYKYTDGQYVKQGKLGAAILGNATIKDYKILLYVSKQQQVTNAKIYSGFSYTVQPNNYATFYDDSRQSWSIMFDTEQASVDFAKQICLARSLSGDGGMEVVSQDLTLGEGGPLEMGDSAEVKYTGWLLTNSTFGKVFDSNANGQKLFRFKLGKGKVIKGWDIGVLGMKKNSKRLLIVPPNFAYGEAGMGDRVPANSTLIFEIEVARVKLTKADSPTESPAPTPTSTPAPAVLLTDDLDDTTVKGRTRSINEQLAHGAQAPKSDKAKLISRMAKMGQPMLPMSGAVPASAGEDQDDDETPEPVQMTNQQPQLQQQQPLVIQAVPVQQQQPMFNPQMANQQGFQQTYQQPVMNQINPQQPMQQPVMNQINPQQPAFIQNLPSQQQQQHQLSLYQPIQPHLQQFQQQPPNVSPYANPQPGNPYGNVYQPPPGQPFPAGNPQSDVNTPILMSEARQQNTEVRLAVGKVSDRVDKILEKLEHMQVHGAGSSVALPGNTPPMENGVLLHNIQKVIQENERLKKELFEKSARIESQNEKIGDLLQRNQRYVEQSNLLLEQRNDTFKNTAAHSQARVLTLEQDKVQIATELSVATAQISSLQLELANLRKKESETKQQLSAVLENTGKNRDEVNQLRISHSDEERKVTELSEALKEEKLTKRQLENQVSQLKEELGDLKLTNESLDKNLNERKKKSGDERKKLEEELEESKAQYEEEIQSLKNKLRKQKSSTDAATAEQVSQLEREITEEWQEKSEKLLKAAEEKHRRALAEMEEEKLHAQKNVKELEKKVQTLKSSGGESDTKVSQMQSRIEELETWKEKYENLRSQAGVMKQKYEERIQDLEEAVENAKTTATSSNGAVDPDTIASEVKKIMSSVYHSLRGQLEAEKSYKGQQTLDMILNTIKSETLKMMKSSKDEESEDESEEESEDEVEERPVVVETIQAQSAVKSEGSSPSKSAKSESPSKKEDRSMASIEADVMSQLIGSGMTVTDSPKSSTEGKKEIVPEKEEVIRSSSAYITGDKGNIHYIEELNKLKPKGKEEIKPVVEPVIKSSKDATTGDKGNIAYLEELEKGKQPTSVETTAEDETISVEDSRKKENGEGPLESVDVDPSEKSSEEQINQSESNMNENNTTDSQTKEEITDIETENLNSNIPLKDSTEEIRSDPVADQERLEKGNAGGITLSQSREGNTDDMDNLNNPTNQDSLETEGLDHHSKSNESALEVKGEGSEVKVESNSESPAGQAPELTNVKIEVTVNGEADEASLTSDDEDEDDQMTPEKFGVQGTGRTGAAMGQSSFNLDYDAPFEELPVLKEEEEEDEVKVNEDNVKKTDDNVKDADENVKDTDEKVKDTDEIFKVTDENVKVTDENVKDTDENVKVTDEYFKDTDENVKVTGDNVKDTDENVKVTDENFKDTDENVKVTDENFKDTDVNIKVTDDNATVADVIIKVTDNNVQETENYVEDTEKQKVTENDAKVTEDTVMIKEDQDDDNDGLLKDKEEQGSHGIAGEENNFTDILDDIADAANEDKKQKKNEKDKKTEDKGDGGFTTAEIEAMLYGNTVSKPSPVQPKEEKVTAASNLNQSGKREIQPAVIEPIMASSATASNLGSQPPGRGNAKGKTDQSGRKEIQPEVIEPMIASSTASSNLSSKPTGGAKTQKSPDKSDQSKDKKAVVEPKIDKSKDYITGDKGNKYYAEQLFKSRVPVSEPLLSKSEDHPTGGDVGNKDYVKQLGLSQKDKMKAVEEPLTSSSTGKLSSKPTGISTNQPSPVEEPLFAAKASSVTSAAPTPEKGKAPKPVVEEPMMSSKTVNQTSAAPPTSKSHDKKAVVEPMISKKTDHVTGDRGNPDHIAKLNQSAAGKAKPVPVVEPLFSKASSHPTGDKGNPYHIAKLEKSAVPTLASREPPPLDDNHSKGDSPLFGEDTTVEDTFGTKPKVEETDKGAKKDKTSSKKDEKKSTDKKTPSKSELLADDSLKEKPPPLFGDEDEDDLDWLS